MTACRADAAEAALPAAAAIEFGITHFSEGAIQNGKADTDDGAVYADKKAIQVCTALLQAR